MRKAPARAFPRAVQLYNAVQIVACSYMVYGLMPSWRNPFGINTEFTREAEWFVVLHYLSKYLDWCDTLFIVLKKKRPQLSLLHVMESARALAGTISASRYRKRYCFWLLLCWL